MFCKHEWEVLSETVTESQLEHLNKVAGLGNGAEYFQSMLVRKHIQVVSCKKCGELKRYVEEI